MVFASFGGGGMLFFFFFLLCGCFITLGVERVLITVIKGVNRNCFRLEALPISPHLRFLLFEHKVRVSRSTIDDSQNHKDTPCDGTNPRQEPCKTRPLFRVFDHERRYFPFEKYSWQRERPRAERHPFFLFGNRKFEGLDFSSAVLFEYDRYELQQVIHLRSSCFFDELSVQRIGLVGELGAEGKMIDQVADVESDVSHSESVYVMLVIRVLLGETAARRDVEIALHFVQIDGSDRVAAFCRVFSSTDRSEENPAEEVSGKELRFPVHRLLRDVFRDVDEILAIHTDHVEIDL